VAAWAVVPVLMWLVGGVVVGGAGVLVAVAGARSARVRRALPWLGALLLALVPVARLSAGLADPGQVSAELVTGGLSELLALLGISLLVVGVVAQELLRPGRERP
jgi:hypothetical protein